MRLEAGVIAVSLLGWYLLYGRRGRQFGRRDDAWADALIVGLALLRIWLGRFAPLYAMPVAPYDDRLFMNLTATILKGEWLGVYNQVTLAKGPFFSLFLAGVSKLGFRLVDALSLIYCLGSWLMVVALRQGKQPVRWWAQVAVFLVVALCPVLADTGSSLRVWRQPLWVGLCLLTMASSIGLACSSGPRLGKRIAWSGGIGVALGLAWLTREETVWLLAPVGMLALFSLARAWLEEGTARWALAPFPALLVAPMLVALVSFANYREYGYFGVVEFKDRAFLDAYGALTRVKPFDPGRKIPITRAAREAIYEVSPAFVELRPELEEGIGKLNMQFSEMIFGIPEEEREIAAAFMLWVLRDAVAKAGYARSYAKSREFYERLAREVSEACATGQLDCVPPRRSMMPPWNWNVHGPKVWPTYKLVMKRVFNYSVALTPRASMGSDAELQWVTELAGPVTSVDPAVASEQADPRRLAVWKGVSRLYNWAAPVLVGLASVLMLARFTRLCLKKQMDALGLATLASWVAVAASSTVVMLVEVTSWNAIGIDYLGATIVIALLPLPICLAWLGQRRACHRR